jgi:hypothetical protein
MTAARKSLAQLDYTSEADGSQQFSSVPGVIVRQSVLKKQFYERVAVLRSEFAE